jgi:hypothetical protein
MGFGAKAKSAILFSYRALPGHSLSDTVAFIRDVASKRILEISTLRSAEKKVKVAVKTGAKSKSKAIEDKSGKSGGK